jgi:hypothetical protein
MAKEKISDSLQRKFDKPQFSPGDAVFFSWLGQKYYGYVKNTKETNWGIQYMVESSFGVKYPCGIQIKGQKTRYNTGCIFFEDTLSIGSVELIKRIQTMVKRPDSTTIGIAGRSTIESGDDNKDVGPTSRTTSNQTKKHRSPRSSKSDVVSPSIGRSGTDNTKKRKTSKNDTLENAIQRQRDFLNGFFSSLD